MTEKERRFSLFLRSWVGSLSGVTIGSNGKILVKSTNEAVGPGT